MTAIIELSELKEVELREVWPTEDKHFTPWLAQEENLALLSETLGLELELEAQEISVGDFQADILCLNTEDDSRVLIENQLERTDHDHLGKTLTYSAGLDAQTVIWIAKKFREEYRAALDHLNEITDERFRYFGVEIKVWQIGNSARAPQFEIVSSPNDWRREVGQSTQRVKNENLTETQLLQKKFWNALQDYMIHKGSPVKCPKPGPHGFLIFRQTSRFSTEAWIGISKAEIGIRLYTKEPNATAYFHLLKEQQEKVERAFGEPLEWDKMLEYKSSRISLRKGDTDPGNETDWPNQHEWFASKLELFDKVFRPRIKALNAADWEPSEDEDDE